MFGLFNRFIPNLPGDKNPGPGVSNISPDGETSQQSAARGGEFGVCSMRSPHLSSPASMMVGTISDDDKGELQFPRVSDGTMVSSNDGIIPAGMVEHQESAAVEGYGKFQQPQPPLPSFSCTHGSDSCFKQYDVFAINRTSAAPGMSTASTMDNSEGGSFASTGPNIPAGCATSYSSKRELSTVPHSGSLSLAIYQRSLGAPLQTALSPLGSGRSTNHSFHHALAFGTVDGESSINPARGSVVTNPTNPTSSNSGRKGAEPSMESFPSLGIETRMSSETACSMLDHDVRPRPTVPKIDEFQDDGNGGGETVASKDSSGLEEVNPVYLSTTTTSNLVNLALHNRKGQKVSVEDFRLLKVIGKGSYGKVMLVEHKAFKKIYAMKMLRKNNIVQRNQVEHTRTERFVLENINHPFIVELYYAFQTPRKLYFILEYCPGGELFYHLSNDGRFSDQKTCFYAAQLLLALQHLHKLDIIYRDLKPENVLLDKDGFLRLTDFGLSKEGINDNFSAKSLCGTPEYLAPEILNQSGHGKAVDWWNLGALIYEMTTGLPPFYTRDKEKLFQSIRSGELKYRSFVSEKAKSLMSMLLMRDPEKRLGGGPRDAEEIKEHPFFASIDWDALMRKDTKPSFQPELESETDVSYFDKDFVKMPVNAPDTLESFGGHLQTDNMFEGFTYDPQGLYFDP